MRVFQAQRDACFFSCFPSYFLSRLQTFFDTHFHTA